MNQRYVIILFFVSVVALIFMADLSTSNQFLWNKIISLNKSSSSSSSKQILNPTKSPPKLNYNCTGLEDSFTEMVSNRLSDMNVQYLSGSWVSYQGDCKYNISGEVYDKTYTSISPLNWTYQYVNGDWELVGD